MPAANIRSEELRATRRAMHTDRFLQKIGRQRERCREHRRNYRRQADIAHVPANHSAPAEFPATHSTARESAQFVPSIAAASDMPDTRRTIAHRTETSPRAANRAAQAAQPEVSRTGPRAKAGRPRGLCRFLEPKLE